MLRTLHVFIGDKVVHSEETTDFNVMMKAHELERTFNIAELQLNETDCGVFLTMPSKLNSPRFKEDIDILDDQKIEALYKQRESRFL